MTIIPAARITGEVVVRPRGVKEMDDKELTAIRERARSLPYVRGTKITTARDDISALCDEVDRLRQELHQSQAREDLYIKALWSANSLLSNTGGCPMYGNEGDSERTCLEHEAHSLVKQALTWEGGAGK